MDTCGTESRVWAFNQGFGAQVFPPRASSRGDVCQSVREALLGFTHSSIADPEFTNQVPVLRGIIGHEAQRLEEGDGLIGGGRLGGVCARR